MRTGYLASVPAYTPSLRILVSWSEAEDEREALARPAAPNHQEEPTCSHAPVEYGIPVLFGPHRPLRDHLARRDGTYLWSHARVRRQLQETAPRDSSPFARPLGVTAHGSRTLCHLCHSAVS
jgi:hypothetical protein